MSWNKVTNETPSANITKATRHPHGPSKFGASAPARSRRISALLTLALAGISLGGCGTDGNTAAKNIGDYFNLRNSFLNPSEVGRFDKANPWGEVRPVTWPILEQFDVVDEPTDRWPNAADPLPSDLVADQKEYAIGASDTVRISVYELVVPGNDYFKETTVSEAGTVTLQNLGAIQVAGLTAAQIEEKIGQLAVEKNLLLPKGNGNPGPQVTVTLLASRTRVFSALGAVARPGTYNVLGNNFRMLDALALVGDGGTQPGQDYIYVIRQAPLGIAGTSETVPTAHPANVPGASAPKNPTDGNPLEAIDDIEKSTTKPATSPSSLTPSSALPKLVRPLPVAVEMAAKNGGSIVLAEADLDAAISGSSTAPAPVPATSTTPAPAATSPTTAPADDLLSNAVTNTTQKAGNYMYIDGKWVQVPASPQPTTLPSTDIAMTQPALPPLHPERVATNANPALSGAESQSTQRVIRIPITPLREGNPKYNIVIRPGDVINLPSVEPGEFYMMGQVARPGVYTLTGRKITLKMAIASAGNLGALAIPRRCEVIRRIGPNQEAVVQVNLQAIFDGEQPDIFLKPNDLVNVGSDMLAPFLAVTRNAYRASYGWGFIYDKNFASNNNNGN